ncbi:MAG: TlpA disulfide reductase family protein [Ilumatobacteraceae bacterium]
MRIRPRLLVASLAVAVAVIALFAVLQRSGGSDDDVDARLSDPGTVITYPNDGLVNDAVVGDPFPDVVLTAAADGSVVSTADLLGEPLVVNVWYTTCPPCAKELPDFATVDAEHDDVRIIGVNAIDSIEVMERFAGERGVEYDLFSDQDAELIDAIGAVAMPVTLFVTSDGMIVEQTGALDADQLRVEIENLVAIDEATA